MVMENTYKEHYTAEDLFEEKQIASMTIYPIDLGDKYIGIKTIYGFSCGTIVDFYLYDNGNVLISFEDLKTGGNLDRLLYKSSFSRPYKKISKKLYDEKYRVAYSDEGVSVISDIENKTVLSESKWKDILDINNGIAIVNSMEGYYNLLRFNLNTKWSNELQYSKEIIYLGNYLYKFRNLETGVKYNLYNAAQRIKSNPRVLYDDIYSISEHIAVGRIGEAQWDIIKVNIQKDHYIEIAYSSFKEPVINGDTIDLVELDDYGNEIPYTINRWGTKLSDDTEEPITEVKKKILPHKAKEPLQEIPTEQDGNIKIGHFIVVNDYTARKSSEWDILITQFSLKNALKCEGYPCWILLKQKLIVITENKSIEGRKSALKVIKYDSLPDEFEQFSKLFKDNKWLYFEDSLSASKADVLSEAIDVITPTLRKQAEEKAASIEEQDRRNIEDTKDILRLKAIYDFLKLQGFDKASICNSLVSLFPEIEEYIDYTNVKQNNFQGWKRYTENVEKLKRIMPDGNVYDYNNIVKELHFTDKEEIIFDYYTKVKGYKPDIAIESIYEESPSGEKVWEDYQTLLRLDDLVASQRRILQHSIIEDIVNNFAAMADTSEMLQLPETSKTKETKTTPFAVKSGETDIEIKGKKYMMKLNESIRYDVFENKKIHLSDRPVSYIQIGRNVLILLNNKKAKELDSENIRQFQIRGSGDEKRFDQDYRAVNGVVANQRENGARIYVFESIDDSTCRFFDEFQCIKNDLVEDENEGRKLIYFTMKSLLRYNKD